MVMNPTEPKKSSYTPEKLIWNPQKMEVCDEFPFRRGDFFLVLIFFGSK